MKPGLMLRSIDLQCHGSNCCLLAFVCLCLCATGGCSATTQENVEFTQGDIQQLQLEDLGGQPYDAWNASEANARVFLFTSIDCPISNRYAPKIGRLYKQFHPQGIDFVLVYSHADETPDMIRQHLVEFAYPCVAVRDPHKTLAKLTQASVTPEAVVIGPDLRMAYRGRIDNLYADFGTSRVVATTNDLADVLEALVEGEQVATHTTEAVGCPIEGLITSGGPQS